MIGMPGFGQGVLVLDQTAGEGTRAVVGAGARKIGLAILCLS